jgi:hypothetical protein
MHSKDTSESKSKNTTPTKSIEAVGLESTTCMSTKKGCSDYVCTSAIPGDGKFRIATKIFGHSSKYNKVKPCHPLLLTKLKGVIMNVIVNIMHIIMCRSPDIRIEFQIL